MSRSDGSPAKRGTGALIGGAVLVVLGGVQTVTEVRS